MRQEHIDQAIALKKQYPFRIIWAAIAPNGQELQGADTTKRQINKMVRLGYAVYILTHK